MKYSLVLWIGVLSGCSPDKKETIITSQLEVIPQFNEIENIEVIPDFYLNGGYPDINKVRALFFMDQKYPLLAPRMLFLDHEWKDASSLPDVNEVDSVHRRKR